MEYHKTSGTKPRTSFIPFSCLASFEPAHSGQFRRTPFLRTQRQGRCRAAARPPSSHPKPADRPHPSDPHKSESKDKNLPKRPASLPSDKKRTTSIEGHPTCRPFHRSKTTIEETPTQSPRDPPAPILRKKTEWRTVPGQKPKQDGKPTSPAPAILFGSRFSFEEKWDKTERKESAPIGQKRPSPPKRQT